MEKHQESHSLEDEAEEKQSVQLQIDDVHQTLDFKIITKEVQNEQERT